MITALLGTLAFGCKSTTLIEWTPPAAQKQALEKIIGRLIPEVVETPAPGRLRFHAANGPCTYQDFAARNPCQAWPTVYPPGKTASPAKPCIWHLVEGDPGSEKRIGELAFEAVIGFSEGLAPVRIGGRWGFLNERGELEFPAIFLEAKGFSEGLAYVRGDEDAGFLSKAKGEIALPLKMPASPFSEGLAVLGTLRTGFSYVTPNGDQPIAEVFALATTFHRGVAHVKLKGPGERYAYIDKTGKHVLSY